MREETAVSSHGQIAQWELAVGPLQHLTQGQLDALIERIDAFVSNEIEQVTEVAK
jgi:hypothetical protein